MAPELPLIPRRFLWFVLAHHFIVVTACHEADYGQLIEDYCLSQFKFDMEMIGQKLWCDWDETVGTVRWVAGERSIESFQLPRSLRQNYVKCSSLGTTEERLQELTGTTMGKPDRADETSVRTMDSEALGLLADGRSILPLTHGHCDATEPAPTASSSTAPC
ncbi:receptor activity-modifying protein 1 isoform X3 [Chrysemys picta bellii]|uniref:receptor activity-modifying protein 1 isoform X3 n=1 Tax=Chrysemys picta bellii TaxID=8478 RepID=UPI0032B2D1B3